MTRAELIEQIECCQDDLGSCAQSFYCNNRTLFNSPVDFESLIIQYVDNHYVDYVDTVLKRWILNCPVSQLYIHDVYKEQGDQIAGFYSAVQLAQRDYYFDLIMEDILVLQRLNALHIELTKVE